MSLGEPHTSRYSKLVACRLPGPDTPGKDHIVREGGSCSVQHLMALIARAMKQLLAPLLSSRPQTGPLYQIHVFIVVVFIIIIIIIIIGY